MQEKTARWTLATLLTLLGVNAVVAGVLFLVRPDGSRLGLSTDLLRAGPFTDFLFPGLALLALGLLAVLAAFLVGWRAPIARGVALVAGAGFLVFLAVEVYVVGTHWLQAVVGLLALGVVALALVPREDTPATRAAGRARARKG